MDFEKITLAELRELAKKEEIKNISKMKKNELISALQEIKSSDASENSSIKEEKKDETTKIDNSNSGYKVTNEDDEIIEGILEVLPDGYGFLRGENYLPSPKDVYISPIQIKRFKLNTGDKIKGISRLPKEGEKFPALICWRS